MFYKAQSLTAALVPALHTALITEPKSLTKQPHEVALDMAKEVRTKVGGELAVGRVVGACVLLGLVLTLATGCVSFTGRPARNARPREILAQLEKDPKTNVVTLIQDYHDTKDADEQKRIRNHIIDLGMIEIDQQYALFVEQFTSSKKTFDTVTDLGSVFASSVSAAMTPPTTKTVLSLVAGGFTATRTSVGKNFFYEQSIKAIIQQMTAERRAVAVDLIKGTGSNVDVYPLAAALQDLERYYFAGTIDGAFAGIQKSAAQKEERANRDIQSIQKELKDVIDYKALAKTWITNNGEDDARARIILWFGRQTAEVLYVAKATLLIEALKSNLTPKKFAKALPKEAEKSAIQEINNLRRGEGNENTFVETYANTVDSDKLVNVLPGQALANFLGAFAKDDILELANTPPTASQ
jgi:DNA-binding transcriptional regulator of glucitol operon